MSFSVVLTYLFTYKRYRMYRSNACIICLEIFDIAPKLPIEYCWNHPFLTQKPYALPFRIIKSQKKATVWPWGQKGHFGRKFQLQVPSLKGQKWRIFLGTLEQNVIFNSLYTCKKEMFHVKICQIFYVKFPTPHFDEILDIF